MLVMVAHPGHLEDEFLLDALKDNSTILCEYRKFGKSKGPAAKKQLKQETAESLCDNHRWIQTSVFFPRGMN